MRALQHERAVQTACLLVLTIFAVAAALVWLRPVVVPFVLALFLAVGLTPLVEIQERRLRMPRVVALGSTLLLGLLLIVLVAVLVTTSVDSMLQSSKRYDGDFHELIESAQRWVGLDVAADDSNVGASAAPVPVPAPADADVGWFRGLLARGTDALEHRFEGAWQKLAAHVATALLATVQNGVLVLIFLGFLILGGHGARRKRGPIWNDIELRVRSYIGTKTLLSAVTGVLVGATLGLFGIELALVFGVFAFLLNFIPSVGSIVACVLPVPVILAAPEAELGLAAKAFAIGLPVLIQFGIGNVLEPKIMGQTLELNPIVILLALIFWGMVWGVVGMFLAVPITVAVKIFVERLGIVDLLRLEPAPAEASSSPSSPSSPSNPSNPSNPSSPSGDRQ